LPGCRRARLLADVADAEIGTALTELWGPMRAGDLEPQPRRRHLLADLVPDQYDRARVLLDTYAGLDLHQLRHSAATHLGEAAIPLQLIMGETRHKNPRTAMRYVKPGAEAIAKVTEVLAPRRRIELGKAESPSSQATRAVETAGNSGVISYAEMACNGVDLVELSWSWVG
jgi:hypothetical protein